MYGLLIDLEVTGYTIGDLCTIIVRKLYIDQVKLLNHYFPFYKVNCKNIGVTNV